MRFKILVIIAIIFSLTIVWAQDTQSDIQILYSTTYPDSLENFYIVGEAKNHEKFSQRDVRINAVLLDSNGSYLTGDWTDMPIINPGETLPFSIYICGCEHSQRVIDEFHSYQLTVTSARSVNLRYSIFSGDMMLSEISDGFDELGRFYVEGVVKNIGSFFAEDSILLVSLYGSEGRIVGSMLGSPDVVDIAPGNSSHFYMGFRETRYVPEIKTYKIHFGAVAKVSQGTAFFVLFMVIYLVYRNSQTQPRAPLMDRCSRLH
jgi:hypothetical protein